MDDPCSGRPPAGWRIWRSWKSPFGKFDGNYRLEDEELAAAPDIYREEELRRIAGEGFNAVWIHGHLHTLVRTSVFPELAPDCGTLERALKLTIDRAARFGVKIFLYMQPLAALPEESDFWTRHAALRGQQECFPSDRGGEELRLRSLCSSCAPVRAYLREAAYRLGERFPGLGGVILITASEYPGHCWSRCMAPELPATAGAAGVTSGQVNCPRCRNRSPVETVRN